MPAAAGAPFPGGGRPAPQASGTEAYIDYVSQNRDAYISLVRGAGGGDASLREVFDVTRARMSTRVLRRLGVPEPAPPRLWLAARGWTAFTEQVVTDWLTTGEPGRDDLVTLLDESLVVLVALAARHLTDTR